MRVFYRRILFQTYVLLAIKVYLFFFVFCDIIKAYRFDFKARRFL